MSKAQGWMLIGIMMIEIGKEMIPEFVLAGIVVASIALSFEIGRWALGK